ncbi:MAG: riboflavin biosynthesis protein RibF [Desulfuromonas sp.]|nr:MAG: riboflavin biosynthesis protein RibF [Desulfuromonas sp.]
MEIIRDLAALKTPLENSIATIGNFDGVHLGHREIFREIVKKAAVTGGVSVVITFVPHPLKVLKPEQAPRLLNTYAEKERLVRASCVDYLVEIPFDQEMAEMSPDDFVTEILIGKLGIRHLVVGYDYAFGRDRSGDADFLTRIGAEKGFSVEVLGPILRGEEIFSSTLARRLLAAGDVESVVEPLGRHFTLEGRVVSGAGRGARLGFPTANLITEKEVLPRPGVYAVKVKYRDALYDGVMNIGFNPTFGSERISLEVHILDFSQDIYGETIRVYFVERLRDEKVFKSADELAASIAHDIEKARAILGETKIIEYRDYLDCG